MRKYHPEDTCRVFELQVDDLFKPMMAMPWKRVLKENDINFTVVNVRRQGWKSAYPELIGRFSNQIVYCKKLIRHEKAVVNFVVKRGKRV